jgi:soluble lytic murein transglycosylase-like protein
MFARIKLACRIALWTAVWTLCLAGASVLYGFTCPPIRVVEKRIQVPVEVERPKRPLADLIAEIAPKYDINPLVLTAIVERESGGKNNAIRFEPGQMARAAKLSKNPEQQRMLASSHGVAQVMGWWAPQLGIDWSDLYDPETNLEVACKIMKHGMDRHKGERKAKQIRLALAEYNGSIVYADAVMQRLGDMLIEERL